MCSRKMKREQNVSRMKRELERKSETGRAEVARRSQARRQGVMVRLEPSGAEPEALFEAAMCRAVTVTGDGTSESPQDF